ncbi:hypothetical protein I633_22636 (plasmid) [Alteromonas mediterranea 615]|uniref:Uncharacterized protein n=1 Tax=Alteromonas mediterranea 615 TaxID=1300253 RepID=S5AIE0_9ALTE|nr:hypothetical protein I633_22636 [Alteromonas mediterranea 615]|tara:strand:+ start:782 stop:1306 length:525 start_codon:yes stop_codon:yes gene_type:complete
MGMFSYMDRITGEQICGGDNVRLYRLVKGKVVEEMRGTYNNYGAVDVEDQTYHAVLKDGEMRSVTDEMRNAVSFSDDIWLSEEWGGIVDEHFSDDETSGICAILESNHYDGFAPTERSLDDPDQGWRQEDEEDEEDDWEDEWEDEDEEDEADDWEDEEEDEDALEFDHSAYGEY